MNSIISLFKASALWADAFYKLKCLSVCLSVRLFVRVFTFETNTIIFNEQCRTNVYYKETLLSLNLKIYIYEFQIEIYAWRIP